MSSIEFNSQTIEWPSEQSLAELLAQHQGQLQGIAVVLNEQLIPRSAWEQTRVKAGDVVNVFRAIAGG